MHPKCNIDIQIQYILTRVINELAEIQTFQYNELKRANNVLIYFGKADI